MSRTRELLEKKRNGGSVTTAEQSTTSRTQQMLAKKGISAGVDHTAPAPTHSAPSANNPLGVAPAPSAPRVEVQNRGLPTDATAEEVSQMIYIGGLTPSSDGSYAWNGNWNESNWRQMLKAYNGGFSFGVEREEDKSSVVPAQAYTGTAVQAGEILTADKQGRQEIKDQAQDQKDAASGVMAGHIGDKATGWDAALNPYLDLVSAHRGVKQVGRLSAVAVERYTIFGGSFNLTPF